jgi:hypothetical protein
MTTQSPRVTKLDITDYVAWGKLVKTWATRSGKYLGDATAYPIPSSVEELREQMARARAGTVPENIKSLQIVAPDDSTLILLLPSKKAIEDTELALKTAGGYPLPPFYWRPIPPVGSWPAAAQLKFNHERVGEYTVLFCA